MTSVAKPTTAPSNKPLKDYTLKYERGTEQIPSRMGNELRYPDGHIEKIGCGNCKECKCGEDTKGGRA